MRITPRLGLLLVAALSLGAAPPQPDTSPFGPQAPGTVAPRAAGAPAPPVPADEPCALEVGVIPDFTLQDVNPGSSTYGRTLSRDELLGRVLVFYWAQAT